MNAPAPLQLLLDSAEQTLPLLKCLDSGSESLIGMDNSAAGIKQLYQALQDLHPQAGSSYWQARCWGLLCWQPLYLALIGVYGPAILPTRLHQIRQGLEPQLPSVSGFVFDHQQVFQATEPELITHACQQLRVFYLHYLAQCQQQIGLGRSRGKALLAEQLLELMVRLKDLKPGLTLAQLKLLANQWLTQLDLPVRAANQLVDETDPEIGLAFRLQRRSCCMVYCCADANHCYNCPKQPK